MTWAILRDITLQCSSLYYVLFNRSRAFRRAWACWAKGSWECWAKALGRPLGRLLEMSWGPFLTSWGSLGGPDGVLGRLWTWRPLGAPKAGWSAKGGLPGANAALLGPKKVVLTASWPLQGQFQERFQPSWRPKGSQKGGQEGAKSSPKRDSS